MIGTVLLLLWGPQGIARNLPTENHAQNPQTKTPKDEESIEEAIRYYKAGAYTEAYRLFKKLELTHLRNLRVQFYLGRCAYETKHYEDAVIAFERVLIARPDDQLVKLEMARSYYAMGNYADAQQLFEEILKENIPSPIRRKIQIYLSHIRQHRTRSFFHGSIMAGIGYDSNVYNRARYDEIFLPAYQIRVENAVIDDDDYYHQEMIDLNHLYDFGERGGFALKNDVSIYFQTMSKHSDKNIFYANYTPALAYSTGNFLLNLAVGFDKMFYGSDPYLHTYYFMPSLLYMHSSVNFSKLTLTFQRKKSDSPLNEGRDANYLMGTILVHWLLNKDWVIEPSFSLIKERKIDSSLTNVNHNAGMLRVWSRYRIAPDKSLSGDLIVKKLHYTDIDFFFLEKRDDIYANLVITFTKKFQNYFKVETSVGYTHNHSDFDTYEYRKFYANVNLVKEF
ncbi:tetratricopeptide repeat protein [Hydrogenimonas urashimensis]|uniref:tetratricopeptide repeat protein n=1 Tax=Hydrogenimonas urashimensis TaxID=2740515 RepID=UPI0019155EA7|nr:tetratricopeptide repeat protein [Hydrogenimonas urashimensis]